MGSPVALSTYVKPQVYETRIAKHCTILLHLHNVEGDKFAPKPVRVAHGEEPDGSDLVLDVDGGRVRLRGSVELRNVLDAEPVHEPLPDGRLEAVAKHDPDLVCGVLLRPRGGQEEPGNLADVLRRGDVVLDAILEEAGRGELLLDNGPEADSTFHHVV